MKVRCNNCGRPMKKRKNHPFGRNSKARVVYYCNCIKHNKRLKGGTK